MQCGASTLRMPPDGFSSAPALVVIRWARALHVARSRYCLPACVAAGVCVWGNGVDDWGVVPSADWLLTRDSRAPPLQLCVEELVDELLKLAADPSLALEGTHALGCFTVALNPDSVHEGTCYGPTLWRTCACIFVVVVCCSQDLGA